MIRYDESEATPAVIDEFREEAFQLGYSDLASMIKDIKAKMEYHNSEQSRYRKFFDALTTQVVPEKMAEDDMQGVKLSNGQGRIELRPNAFCSVAAGQGAALQDWLKENGYEDIIKETVNASTLKSFVKDLIASGQDTPPEEIVNYTPYVRATVVKSS